MRELNSKLIVPPGGWKYTVPLTGEQIAAGDFASLIRMVITHLTVNNLLPGLPDYKAIEATVEDAICEGISPSLYHVVGSVRQKTMPVTSRDMSGTQNFCSVPSLGSTTLARTVNFLTVIKRRYRGLRFVPQVLADARAQRAITDPYMFPMNVCYSCKHKGPVDQAMGGMRETAFDPELHVCGIFGVYLRPLVHIHADILKAYLMNTELLDEKFWLKPEL